MRLEDFDKQGKDEWTSKESVSTILGELPVALNIHDRAGPPDETMLKLAAELVAFAKAHGDSILDAIYAHYREAEENDNLDVWDVPGDLNREQILSEVQHVSLSVSRDKDAKKPYASYIYVIPNWEEEHALYLRSVDGKLVEFDPMAGEMHR